jgi:hypothetical protein
MLKIKKGLKKIKAVSKGLKEKVKKAASHITPEIQRLINKGFRLSRPNTEPHKVYQLCKKHFFKVGKLYNVSKFPDFDNKNLCLNAQNLITELTGLKLTEKIYDKTRNKTQSKKKVLSFRLVK